MIKYMVVKYTWNITDSWLDILWTDLPDNQIAEQLRSRYLEQNSGVSADNVSVIQYRE